MTTIRLWALESDHDAKAVKYLATKLANHRRVGDLSIQASGKRAIPRYTRRGGRLSDRLRRATQNYLKEDTCVIFVIDQDSPMSLHQRRQEPNSLINQIEAIINEPSLNGKVFLVLAIQELEAWLRIDCLGIFCYFASEREELRENGRNKVTTNTPFAQLINDFQVDNTEDIVEKEIGGSGPKEYLVKFSEALLRKLNPDIRQMDVYRQRYCPAMAPALARFVDINDQTLLRNNSLRCLGDVLAQFD